MEKSEGNYHFLTIDSNILRATDLNLIVACLNTLALFTLFLVSVIFYKNRLQIKKFKYSKYLFRAMEFIYKTTMYPLIFFAL